MPIYVVGKQWMWKLQHMEGQREINELHIPARPCRQAHHDLRRRDPQLLRACFPHQAGRGARPLYHHLVPAHQAGQVPPVLRRILRHQALRHDRLDLRDGAARSTRTGSAAARATGSLAIDGEKLFQDLGLRQLPQAGRHRPLPQPRRSVRQHRAADRRRHGHGGRSLHPRIDPASQRQNRRGLPADHADLPGPGHRGGRAAVDRIHQVAWPKPVRHGHRERPAPANRTAVHAARIVRTYDYRSRTRTRALPERQYGIKSWLLTKDHKRIGLLYLVTITCSSSSAAPSPP